MVYTRATFMITLRAIEKDDLKRIQRWRNSDDVMPYCRQYKPLSQSDMLVWYDGLTKDKEYNLVNDLQLIELDGIPIGVGGFVRIDWRNRKAEVSFYVGEISKSNPATIQSALMAIVQYGFTTLNLWKVYFPVYSNNNNLETYKEVLKEEYVAKKEYYWNGKYLDRIILVKYNEAI